MVNPNYLPTYLKVHYPFTGNYFVTPNGKHRLHYLDEGKGPVLIFLHGNPTWSFYYRNLVKAFRGEYRIIVPDHIGMGCSDKPAGHSYTLQNHVENLTALIEHLQLKNITLVVHDWGGAIGMGYATANRDNVKSVVIQNTAAFTSDYIPPRINFCRTPKIWSNFLIKNLNGFAFPATFMAVNSPMASVIKKGYLLPYKGRENRVAIAKFVQDIPMEKTHPTYEFLHGIEKKLPLLTCPKLILWGGKDFCFNDYFLKRWREIYPEARAAIFDQAGHYLLEDALEGVVGEMRAFFKRESV